MEIKFPNQKSGKWSVILGAPRESGDNTSVLSFGYCKGFIEHLCKSLNLWSGWPRKDLFYNMYCLQWFISAGTSARNKQNLFFLHKVSVVTRLSDNHCINVDPVSLRHCINVMCPLGRHVKSFSFFVRLCNFCVTWMCYIKTKQKKIDCMEEMIINHHFSIKWKSIHIFVQLQHFWNSSLNYGVSGTDNLSPTKSPPSHLLTLPNNKMTLGWNLPYIKAGKIPSSFFIRQNHTKFHDSVYMNSLKKKLWCTYI